MEYREYIPSKDRDAIFRVWREVGWIDKDRGKDKDRIVDDFLACGKAYVAEIRSEAECLVTATPGEIKYQDKDLAFCAVSSVSTSRIARRKNIATNLTALALSNAVSEGYHVAGLGIFDQGFYNKLGFGNGAYENLVAFDPSNLTVETCKKIPYRLNSGDFERIHDSRLRRFRGHGSISLLPCAFTHMDLSETKNGFGLGFLDEESGRITHHMWILAKGENGPYDVYWMAYEDIHQLPELLAVLKDLSDQVFTVRLREPPGIQIQDLLTKPLRFQQVTRHGRFENSMIFSSCHQVRMLAVVPCVKNTRLQRDGPKFNLRLHDPIEKYLPENSTWRGVSGHFTVEFGRKSSITTGTDSNLPTMSASVGAFTRMWLGVRAATSLSVTDDLEAEPGLLSKLDELFRLPAPIPDWEF